MNRSHLIDCSASELSTMIEARDVSCLDVMTEHLERINEIECILHAFVTRRPDDELLEDAARLDASLDAGVREGWMHGLPYAVKDLVDARGLPTTLGFFSPLERAAATVDETFVGRVRQTGAVVVGKTNTPEFGLGSHTYNRIAPTTVNVVDSGRSAGGSSGGAAVAVAAGLVAVADGSDFMGSIRNPPGWNGVLGMRPSPGVVLERDDDRRSPGFAVDGPIARTTRDLVALLRTMAEPSVSIGIVNRSDAESPRIAWLTDICEGMPFESGVLEVCRSAAEPWSPALKDRSIPTHESFTGAASLWPTWLTMRFQAVGGWLSTEFSAEEVSRMKPEAQSEIEGYRQLGGEDVARAERAVCDLRTAVTQLFDDFDLLVLPTAQVWPFPAEQAWPTHIAGRPMTTYHRWMEVATFATLAALPTIAVPAGRDARGLHIGLQVIGRPGGDSELLGWAARAERLGCFTVQPPTSAVGASANRTLTT
jgi:amidase